jgi:hypothetical protein
MRKACYQTQPGSVALFLILTSFRDRPGTSVSTLGDAVVCATMSTAEDFYHLSIRGKAPCWITQDDERVGPQLKVDGAAHQR